MATTAASEKKSARPDNTSTSTVDIPSVPTVWHRSAPSAVKRAYRAGKHAKGWAAWLQYLDSRRDPVALKKLLPGAQPLGWALPPEADARGTTMRLARLKHLGSKQACRALAASSTSANTEPITIQQNAIDWLDEPPSEVPDPCWALEALAWCHSLHRLGGELDPETWWALLDHLLEIASSAGKLDWGDHPLFHQLVAGELALTLGYWFPEIVECRQAARAGRRALSLGLVKLTDGQGLLHGKYFETFRPLLASWTRCRAIGNELSKGSWSQEAQIQYEWLVRHALRLTRHDGTPTFRAHSSENHSASTRDSDLFRAALVLGGDPSDRNIAMLALPKGMADKKAKKTKQAQVPKKSLPEPAYHSPWSATSVLRTGWSPRDPRLVAIYPDHEVRLELESSRSVLLSGAWDLDIRHDGDRIEPVSKWDDICWVSDDDVDYLELQIELAGGIRVQRHLLLAREDQFLLLADAVLGNQPAEIEYRGCVSLGSDVSLEVATASREAFLVARKPTALVLPLALPEWRGEAHDSVLQTSDDQIELFQSTRGSSLFAPLFIDLKTRRLKYPFTWRRLTVAENLAILPDDVAVGYRVQVGRRQWLIYRSLGQKGNRTLLGHNLSTEFLVGRFDHQGEVETLIEIE